MQAAFGTPGTPSAPAASQATQGRTLEQQSRAEFPGAWIIENERPIATLPGSCVAVCLRDPALHMGGMNHFMLPEMGKREHCSNMRLRKKGKTMIRPARQWPLLLLLCSLAGPLAAAEYYEAYKLPKDAATVDVAAHPLSLPTGMIGTLMQRDRILKRALQEIGLEFASYPFRKGPDNARLMASGQIEAGPLGDMPTAALAATTDLVIAGLVKQSTNAIVSAGEPLLGGLKGKRIGYVPNSSSHFTLLQGLSSAGMNDKDVTLVALALDELPKALLQGRIDAFSGWEPATGTALADNREARVIYRGTSATYFVLTRDFVRSRPAAALLVVASFARAIEWLRRDAENLRTAARWFIADNAAFAGKPGEITLAQAVAVTRSEMLDVPTLPALPPGDIRQSPPLLGEYRFMQRIGQLPSTASWEKVGAAFDYDGLRKVYAAPKDFNLYSFDYVP